MKKIKSRYAIHKIKDSNIESLTNKEENQNYIFAPFIIAEHSEESSKRYDKLHKLCPKCKSNQCISTLIGYILKRKI